MSRGWEGRRAGIPGVALQPLVGVHKSSKLDTGEGEERDGTSRFSNAKTPGRGTDRVEPMATTPPPTLPATRALSALYDDPRRDHHRHLGSCLVLHARPAYAKSTLRGVRPRSALPGFGDRIGTRAQRVEECAEGRGRFTDVERSDGRSGFQDMGGEGISDGGHGGREDGAAGDGSAGAVGGFTDGEDVVVGKVHVVWSTGG